MSNSNRVLNTDRTDPESLDGQCEVFRRAGRRGEIEHVLHAAGIEGRADITLLESEAWFVGKMRQILESACGEIIDSQNVMAFSQKSICKMRAEKAGRACNEYALCQDELFLHRGICGLTKGGPYE